MRLANLRNRATILVSSGAVDVESLTGGEFGPDLGACFDDWTRFVQYVTPLLASATGQHYDVADLGCPVPSPRQIFAIGLNYADHARETGMAAPEHPVVFTKFASSLSGPVTTVRLSSESVDFEAELVVVIGTSARDVARESVWGHVAGLCVGQDISDREIQTRGGAGAQWSLGKSLAGFSPVGPAVVTIDELNNPDDLAIRAAVGDEVLQDSRTYELIFDIPALVSYLSKVVTLYPGDLIFTGTPAGVGIGRDPKRYLRNGETLITEIEQLGRLETTFIS